MSPENFQSMLSFFNENLYVDFLYWVTCYGGGPTLNFAYEPFSNISSLKFPVASGATTQRTVTLSWKNLVNDENREFSIINGLIIPTPPISLQKYFEKIENEESIENFLSTITDLSKNANNIPYLKIKDNEIQLINVDKKIENITHTKTTAHVIEKKPLVINPEKTNVILHPEIMPITIAIDNLDSTTIILSNENNSQFISNLKINQYTKLLLNPIKGVFNQFLYVGTLSLSRSKKITPTIRKEIVITTNTGNDITSQFIEGENIFLHDVVFILGNRDTSIPGVLESQTIMKINDTNKFYIITTLANKIILTPIDASEEESLISKIEMSFNYFKNETRNIKRDAIKQQEFLEREPLLSE